MGLLKPNINKLFSAEDVGGLRAALRHKDPEVRHDAVQALGLIELPPKTRERRGIVPQEVVAELLACWRGLMAQRGPGQAPRFQVFGEAIARIDGPAGLDTLVKLHADQHDEFWVQIPWIKRSEWESIFDSIFALLDTEDLTGILLDETRALGLRSTAHRALLRKAHFSNGAPADVERINAAVAEYERRKEQRELDAIAEELDGLIRSAQSFGDPAHWQERISSIGQLARSRDPRAIEALVTVVLREDLKDNVRQAAQDALIKIGEPTVGHIVTAVSEPHPVDGVKEIYSVLAKILQREGEDLGDESLASIAGLGEVQGIVYDERLNPDDTYDITKSTVSIDFSPIASTARARLTRRGSQA